MRPHLPIATLTLSLAGALIACTKSGDTARLKADFDHICAAQRDFLSARKMKGVDEAELLVERIRRMQEGLTAEAAIQAAEKLTDLASQAMRTQAEEAAKAAGLENWSCPELAGAKR